MEIGDTVFVPTLTGLLVAATVYHITATTVTTLQGDRLSWWYGNRDEVVLAPTDDSPVQSQAPNQREAL